MPKKISSKRIRQVLRVFGLLDAPPPDRLNEFWSLLGFRFIRPLTEEEINELAAMTVIYRDYSSGFHRGDLLNWVEKHQGRDAAGELRGKMSEFNKAPTLYNNKSIAAAVPITERVPELSFNHYESVRKLPPPQQRELLRQAIAQKMTNAYFRRWVRSQVAAAGQARKPAKIAALADLDFAVNDSRETVEQFQVEFERRFAPRLRAGSLDPSENRTLQRKLERVQKALAELAAQANRVAEIGSAPPPLRRKPGGKSNHNSAH